MPDFKAKMHQNRFRLGELTALPRPRSWIRGPTCKGRGGEGWGEGKVGRGEKRRREGEGRPPNVRNALTPLPTCHIVKVVLHINWE